MSGTRRMWSRRVLRAGWLIAPLFTIPGRALRSFGRGLYAVFFDRYGKFETGLTIMFAMVAFAIYMFAMMIVGQNAKFEAADPDRIKAAMADQCHADELMDRLRVGMLRGWDIERAEAACEQKREQQAQLRMMEQQRAMLGAK